MFVEDENLKTISFEEFRVYLEDRVGGALKSDGGGESLSSQD